MKENNFFKSEHEPLMHTVWMELSRPNLEDNLKSISNIIGPKTKIIPMLKANGYGLGAVQIGRELERLGTKLVGVSSLREAYDLRLGKINTNILVTDWVHPNDLSTAFDLNTTLTVSHPGMFPLIEENAKARGIQVKVHVFIDTGMNREGIWPPEAAIDIVEAIHTSSYIKLDGLMTHFASPTNPDLSFTYHQLEVFNQCLDEIESRGIPMPPYVHAAEGAAIMRVPETHREDPKKRFTAVRPGNIVYGLPPGGRDFPYMKFIPKPVLSGIKAYLTSIKTIQKGGAVGYDRETIEPGTQLGIIAIGHTDGYRPSRLKEPINMLVHGKRVPVIGREAMTQLILKLPKDEEFHLGDEVVIVGKQGNEQIPLEDIAKMENGSLIRELVQLSATRLPRIVINT